MNKYFIIILLFSLFTCKAIAQELNTTVSVIALKTQIVDPAIFKTLENDIAEFMNNRAWTNHIYQQHEKIDVSIVINVTEELSQERFNANALITVNRPVYNSSYNTVLFSHNDKDWTFDYIEFESIEFDETTFRNNLSSLLAFYAYYAIGMDYDTYKLNGGEPWFTKAKAVLDNAQVSKETGWKAYENQKNRYWLIEQLKTDRYKAYHKVLYDYHRMGLDLMYSNPTAGRLAISNAIKNLHVLFQNNPGGPLLFQTFFNAKSEELVSMYAEAPAGEKAQTLPLLMKMDPQNTNAYTKALKKR